MTQDTTLSKRLFPRVFYYTMVSCRAAPPSVQPFISITLIIHYLHVRAQLLQRYRKRETFLEVNLGHVNEFRPDLLDMLTLRPVEYLPLFEQV